MSLRRSALLMVAVGLASLLPGCAWANRDNRQVWNAFEKHAVPQEDVWFVVSLPLTVPVGFLAILLDTFIVHPAMVVDDAFGDTRDLWRGMDWEDRYYTESAALPLRAAASPVWFVFAFLGRSTFDVGPYEPPLTAEEQRERVAELDARSADLWLAWFDSLAAGAHEPMRHRELPAWTNKLELGFQEARRRATALGRAELYTTARSIQLPPHRASPWMGLDDPDPVVRHLVLVGLPLDAEVSEELKRALLEDPSETIRQLAASRW